jgi:hypothetical protein
MSMRGISAYLLVRVRRASAWDDARCTRKCTPRRRRAERCRASAAGTGAATG